MATYKNNCSCGDAIETLITKGDDLQSFGGEPIRIDIINEEELIISKAVVVINEGAIVKEYENPENVIFVELDSKETRRLQYKNVMKLICFDENEKKRTCLGELVFYADKEVLRGS